MNRCPECRQPLIRQTNMVPGAVVFTCRSCRTFQVEGSTEWVPAGPGFRDELARIAGVVKVEKSIDEEAMMSPSTDPRWERMYD